MPDQRPPSRKTNARVNTNNLSSDGSIYSSSRDHEFHDAQNSPGSSTASNAGHLQQHFVQPIQQMNVTPLPEMSTFHFEAPPATNAPSSTKLPTTSPYAQFEPDLGQVAFPQHVANDGTFDSNIVSHRDKSLGLAHGRFAELYGLTSDMEPILMVRSGSLLKFVIY